MAGEIQFIFETTGSDLYFVLRNLSAQMWNTAGTPAFEARTVANWGDYDIAMSETPADSFLYLGDIPAVDAGWYWVDIYERAGATPAIADDTLVGQMLGYWDGTTFRLHETDIQSECEAAIAASEPIEVNAVQLGGVNVEVLEEPIDTNIVKAQGRDIGDVGVGNTAHLLQSPDTGATTVSRLSAAAIAVLEALAAGTPSGNVVTDASNATTEFTTDLIGRTDNFVEDAWLLFTSGNLSGEAQPVSAYNGTTGVFTVGEAFTDVPADDSDFVLIGRKQ